MPWFNKNNTNIASAAAYSTEQCHISNSAEVSQSHCEMLKTVCRSNQCIISYQYCTIWDI